MKAQIVRVIFLLIASISAVYDSQTAPITQTVRTQDRDHPFLYSCAAASVASCITPFVILGLAMMRVISSSHLEKGENLKNVLYWYPTLSAIAASVVVNCCTRQKDKVSYKKRVVRLMQQTTGTALGIIISSCGIFFIIKNMPETVPHWLKRIMLPIPNWLVRKGYRSL